MCLIAVAGRAMVRKGGNYTCDMQLQSADYKSVNLCPPTGYCTITSTIYTIPSRILSGWNTTYLAYLAASELG